MRKLFVALIAACGLLFGAAGAAQAQNPHFIFANAQVSGANLDVNWKEAGLGDNQLIAYEANATATATYVCVNRGGANPSAANKTTVTAPVSKTGTFSSGKNGQITASLTVEPPGSGGFSCPPGQSLQIALATYTNVSITDTTNGITETVPGTISTGCLLPEVRGAC